MTWESEGLIKLGIFYVRQREPALILAILAPWQKQYYTNCPTTRNNFGFFRASQVCNVFPRIRIEPK